MRKFLRPLVSGWQRLFSDKRVSSSRVEEMVNLMKAGSEDDRARAAISLGLLRDASVLKPLTNALADPDPLVRYQVVEALGYLYVPQARRALQRAAADRDQLVCRMAKDALTRLNASQRENRRVSPRRQTNIPVYFSVAERHDSGPHRGYILDLSGCGMMLGTRSKLEPGMRLRLLIRDGNVRPLHCSVRVIRQSGKHRFGCAIHPPGLEQSRRLARLLTVASAHQRVRSDQSQPVVVKKREPPRRVRRDR
jgi:hypothetical protein